MSLVTPDSPLIQQLAGPNSWRLTPATLAAKISNGDWIAAKHLAFAAAKIASRLVKGNARLIVNMPARHGKSELLSVYTTIWALDRDPRNEVILTSYGADLADDFGQKARDIIMHDNHQDGEHLLKCRIRKDSARVNKFLTTLRGGMRSVGIGGAVLGRGADLLFVDDYLKNAKEAGSEIVRNDCHEWFISTARTRLEPGGSIVILAHRWDLDDLCGRLEKSGDWEVIKLRAIAEDDDPLGRKPGEALWPERYSIEALESLKADLGDYWWSALYQQEPKPRSARLVDIPIIDLVPDLSTLKLVRYWDLASTPEGGDYTVGTLMGLDLKTQYVFILDVIREQLGPSQVEGLVRRTAHIDGHNVGIGIEQEPGSSGKLVVNHFAEDVLPGFIVEPGRFTGNKFIKAQPFYAAMENYRVLMKRGDWNTTFLDELKVFPTGLNDDQADSASGAYNMLNKKKLRSGAFGRELDLGFGASSNDNSSLIQFPTPGTIKQSGLILGATWGR